MSLLSLAFVTLSVFSGNPYCGKGPGSFGTPFLPYCEGQMDQVCVGTCIHDYKQSMYDAYNFCCISYSVGLMDYREALRDDLNNYMACLDLATTPAEQQACLDDYNYAVAYHDSLWEDDKAQLADLLDSLVQQATSAFESAIADCCEH